MAAQAKIPTPDIPSIIAVSSDLPPVITEGQRILKEMASQFPKTVTGLERQMTELG